MGSNRMFNEALSQALQLEAEKATAKPLARLQVVRALTPWKHRRQGPKAARLGDLYTGSVVTSVILGGNVDRNVARRAI
jgi:hypothetical protein